MVRLRTVSKKITLISVAIVSIMLGFVHNHCFDDPLKEYDSVVYAIKFFVFLLGSYSLLQSWGRPYELNQLREELDEADGDKDKISKISKNLDEIKKDKEKSEFFLILTFFVVLILFLFGKA
jgi:hypothetical protein